MLRPKSIRLAPLASLLAALICPAALAQTSQLTVLHTNDLHSHFRAVKSPGLMLGGLARIKTAVDQVRANVARQGGATVMFDGGDWSEGGIYFTADVGQSSLRLLDSLGYDAMVVGNHDWLVGPDLMIDTLKAVTPKLAMISTNLDPTGYARESEFRSVIVPHTIITRTVRLSNGSTRTLKIAAIGISTYELVYDDFVSPIKVADPFKTVRETARAVRSSVDLIVGVSHNRISMNADLLKQIPELDLIVGAHDHVKLVDPVIVKRPDGTDAWIVETGAWGEFLGRLELTVDWSKPGRFPNTPRFSLLRSKLIQIDDSLAEDPTILAELDRLESAISKRSSGMFTAKIASSEIEIGDKGQESLLGNIITDAYLASDEVKDALRRVDPAGAKARPIDLALEHAAFINGLIPIGDLTEADIFDAHPSVWNPITQKSWTVHTFDLSGRSLAWLLNLMLAVKPHSGTQTVALSGAEVLFTPAMSGIMLKRMGVGAGGTPASLSPVDAQKIQFNQPRVASSEEVSKLLALNEPVGWAAKEVKIGGKPIDLTRTYRVASSQGIIYTLKFIERYLPGAIAYSNIYDTGVEAWRTLKSRVEQVSPLTLRAIPYGNRLRRYQAADIGMTPGDVTATAGALSVTITNYGTVASRAGLHQVGLEVNLNGTDLTLAPKLASISTSLKVPALKPGQSTVLKWTALKLPPLKGKWAEVYVTLKGNPAEINASRAISTRWIPITALSAL